MEENEGLPDIHKMKYEYIRDEILQDNFLKNQNLELTIKIHNMGS